MKTKKNRKTLNNVAICLSKFLRNNKTKDGQYKHFGMKTNQKPM